MPAKLYVVKSIDDPAFRRIFETKIGAQKFIDSMEKTSGESFFLDVDQKKKHGHPRFYELLESLADLHSAKNHDYAGDDPLSNFRMCEEMGLPAWKGVVVRLTDKWARLLNFTKKEELLVKDESFIDTLRDNAIYSLLCIILFEEKNQNDTS
jgi:hypothetical protein